MAQTTVVVFEILEKIWHSLGCQLVDMKIEFGVDVETNEILLADVIDSDSWRLWPSGDKRLMKDKQVYRNLVEVTQEALDQVKQNFAWTLDKLKEFKQEPYGRVVVLMGAPSDMPHCNKIKDELDSLKVPCFMKITSAHKTTCDSLKTIAKYEADNVPTVFIGVAGRSNGLGPVASANTTYPVINSPPVGADWAAQDVWSSLRLPSGLGAPTVLLPETAAIHAAQILAVGDVFLWARLRAKQLNTRKTIFEADKKINN
jgi:phosphoribosylaminoimidazole carboxylase/phosphoribosylaminoimidazole-succinocarboxamide synthase